jgi:hypothetical protein
VRHATSLSLLLVVLFPTGLVTAYVAMHLPVLALVAIDPVSAEEPAPVAPAPPPFSERAAWLGVSGVPIATASDVTSRRLSAVEGLGVAWAETAVVRWGDIEPRPPDSVLSRYDWKALDDTVTGLQRVGLAPLLVLSPASPWACVEAEQSAWTAFARQHLPEAEAAPAIASARGVLPVKPEASKHWQRFVQDLVERYDGDGKRDMPGLRRPVLDVQVLDQVQSPAHWRGSAEDYQRLLHFARAGAEEAHAGVTLLHAAVDLRGLFQAGDGEPDRWKERLEASLPEFPRLARLEVRRGIELVLADLAFLQLFDGVPHVGSGSLREDARNLAALRELLAARGGPTQHVWLSQGPTRRLGTSRFALPDETSPPEEQVRRARLLAMGLRAPEGSDARRWLRYGTAYDLVRGAALARAAGAERVLTSPLGDDGAAGGVDVAGGTRVGGLVHEVASGSGPSTFQPTPAWYAARQLNRLTLGHRDAALAPLGAPGTAVVFRFPDGHEREWVAVLLPDASPCWAEPPGELHRPRRVAVPMPDGPVEVEPILLEDGAPKRRAAVVEDGLLELEIGCAPLYVLQARR